MKVALLACVAVVACAEPKVAAVTVAPLPAPSGSVAPVALPPAPTVAAFLDAGCKAQPNDATLLDCKGAHVDGADPCTNMLHVLSVSFGRRATVAECFIEGDRHPSVRRAGCMLPMSVRLIAATRAGFVVIDSPDALAKTFGPVTSPDEAIAFAVALTGSEAIGPNDRGAQKLGTTEAHAVGDDFHAKLFTTPRCGCHHATVAIDYAVTRAGEVHEVDRKEVWSDPKLEGLCID
ncbi:MAG TPA: hypothetical protein VGH28_23535 [Polyangiaceae bacterium]